MLICVCVDTNMCDNNQTGVVRSRSVHQKKCWRGNSVSCRRGEAQETEELSDKGSLMLLKNLYKMRNEERPREQRKVTASKAGIVSLAVGDCGGNAE